jgi:hypothetical protein
MLYFYYALVQGAAVSINHLTFDPLGQVYTLHFGGQPTADELTSTLWRLGEFPAFVAAADMSKTEGEPTIYFTLLPGSDPVTSLDTLRRVLKPRLPYTLIDLTVTVTNERCRVHTATHVLAFFARGLAPQHDFLIIRRLIDSLLTPRGRELQLARNKGELLLLVQAAHEAQGVFQQGKTSVKFVRAKAKCPDCAAEKARLN